MLDITQFLPLAPVGKTEVVSVEIDGVRYTAFMRAQVRASYKEAARAFELSIAAEPGASAINAIFHAGAEVSIYATNDLLLRGYVDQKRPHLGASDAFDRSYGALEIRGPDRLRCRPRDRVFRKQNATGDR